MKNRSRIEQIVELFKKSFPMGWMDGLDWTASSADALATVKDKQKSFEDETFYLFSQSVLSGEYLIRGGYSGGLESMYELLSNAELYDDESNQLKTVAVRSFNEMTYLMIEVIRGYRHFLTTLNNKYAERQTKYIFNAYRVHHQINSSNPYGGMYSILIEITRTDHFLSYGKKTIDNLIVYHTELTKVIEVKNLSEKVRLSLDVLNKKCLFLLKKLLVDDNREFDYMIDFKPHHYDTSRMDLGYLVEMDRKFEFYRAESYSNDARGNEMDVRARNQSLPIGQYTLLMKYYKDSKSTSSQQIDNILKDFNKYYDYLSGLFTKRPLDIYALGTLKNYMYNCRFSFLMSNPAYTFEQLQADLNEIIDIQYKTGILNFYPYRKAFEKALQLFRQCETVERVKLEHYKDFLRLCITKFSEAMQWCRTNCFYPIQNTYRECLVPVTGYGSAVFVASSYCRPVRYDKLKDELNYFKSQALLVDNEIALREEQEEMRSLKKDIDNSRTKEVEVLSFFTAIITFLFGTIGFFADNKNNDFLHLIFSIFGLGAILLIFVSGIHLTTMRKENKVTDYFKHPRAWFCIFTIIVSVVLLAWMIFKVNVLKTL